MIDSLCMIDSRYLRTLEKQRVLDEQELESMMADRGRFLSCALSNYLKCLQFGDRHDMRVFRVTSLWFDNASQSEINDTMQVKLTSCLVLPCPARMHHQDKFAIILPGIKYFRGNASEHVGIQGVNVKSSVYDKMKTVCSIKTTGCLLTFLV